PEARRRRARPSGAHWRRRRRLGSRRLPEFERHAVALADGVIGGAVEFRIGRRTAGRGQALGRQGPAPDRVILGVAGVGADLAGGLEQEAGLGRQLLDEGLLDIAGGGRRILVAGHVAAVLLDA